MKISRIIKILLRGVMIGILFHQIIYSQQETKKLSDQNSTTLRSNKFKYNEAEQAAVSEFVVIGTVLNIKDTPAPRTEMFHSEVIVKIDRILKGNINYRKIIIRLQSGALLNDIHGDRLISSDEPRFNVGEHVILFLNSARKDNFLNSPGIRKMYKTFNGKSSITQLSDSTFCPSNHQAFKMKDGIVYYLGGPRNKNNFINNITKSK